jgi:hypothetical protein
MRVKTLHRIPKSPEHRPPSPKRTSAVNQGGANALQWADGRCAKSSWTMSWATHCARRFILVDPYSADRWRRSLNGATTRSHFCTMHQVSHQVKAARCVWKDSAAGLRAKSTAPPITLNPQPRASAIFEGRIVTGCTKRSGAADIRRPMDAR